MKFSEKIDKLLIHNDKKIHSIGDLERHVKLGLHTIRAAINENREPLRSTQVKIVEGMGVKWEWWNTGKGEIFREKHTSMPKEALDKEELNWVGTINSLQRLIDDQDKKLEEQKVRLEQLTVQLDECRSRKVSVN